MSYINKKYEKAQCLFYNGNWIIQTHSFNKNVSCYCIIKSKENQNSPVISILRSEKNNYSYTSRNFTLIKVLFPTQSNQFHRFSPFLSSSCFWGVILVHSLYFRTILKSNDKDCQLALGKTSKLALKSRICNQTCYLPIQRLVRGIFSFGVKTNKKICSKLT